MTNGLSPIELEPFFLDTNHGQLFAFLTRPRRPVRRAVVVFPAFAEEMNKCRHICAQLGRRLARSDVACLQIDLKGTGESEGDFAHATWQIWCDNMRDAMAELRRRGIGQFVFLGIRTGALLAADVARRLDPAPDQMVFWQPVTDGRQQVTQFLRLRLAANMTGGGGNVNLASLREEAREKGHVEVAGYALHHEMLDDMEKQTLLEYQPAKTATITWFDVARDATRPVAPARSRVLDHFTAQGARATIRIIESEAFWSTVELVDVPNLIDATVDACVGI